MKSITNSCRCISSFVWHWNKLILNLKNRQFDVRSPSSIWATVSIQMQIDTIFVNISTLVEIVSTKHLLFLDSKRQKKMFNPPNFHRRRNRIISGLVLVDPKLREQSAMSRVSENLRRWMNDFSLIFTSLIPFIFRSSRFYPNFVQKVPSTALHIWLMENAIGLNGESIHFT